MLKRRHFYFGLTPEKKNEQNKLNSKAIELSNIVEQNLEELLNELIANNYKLYNNDLENTKKINTLVSEINQLAENMLVFYQFKKFLSIEFPKRKKNSEYRHFVSEIMRITKFANHLKDINNALELIKTNINELYKYPAFKKQAYIPEFSLALSGFFKENIDIFFMRLGEDERIKNKVALELSKIISLGNKIMNEFFIHIFSKNEGYIKDSGNQVIYYSNIISLLELISINSLEFTTI